MKNNIIGKLFNGCKNCAKAVMEQVNDFYGYGTKDKIIPVQIRRLSGNWHFYTKCWGLGHSEVVVVNGERWIYIFACDPNLNTTMPLIVRNLIENGEVVMKIKEQVLIDLAITEEEWCKLIWSKKEQI